MSATFYSRETKRFPVISPTMANFFREHTLRLVREENLERRMRDLDMEELARSAVSKPYFQHEFRRNWIW